MVPPRRRDTEHMTKYFARSKEDPYICLLRWGKRELEKIKHCRKCRST